MNENKTLDENKLLSNNNNIMNKNSKQKKQRYNKEREAINLEILKEADSLEIIKEKMDKKYNNVKIQLDKEFEVFIRNVEFSVTSKQLVEFINNKLAALYSLQNISVTRCQILTKGITSRGCAIVLLRSEALFDSLKSIEDSLILNGRKLILQKGDGSSKFKRKKHNRDLQIGGQELQLGYHSSMSFITKWTNCSSLSLEIEGSSGKIIIFFKIESALFKIEHIMRNIRKLRVQVDKDTNQVVISFSVKQPPHLFREEQSKSNMTDFLDMSFIADLVRGMQKNKNLWELDVEDHQFNWIRTVDPTSSNAFGHCMAYRYLLNMGIDDKPVLKLMKVLREFSFLSRDIELEFCLPSVVHEVFDEHAILENLQKIIPYKICYLLHCLVGANKFNLEGTKDHSVSDTKFVRELLNLITKYGDTFVEEALLQCFSDPRVQLFSTEDLLESLSEICDYMSDEENIEKQKVEMTVMMRRVLVTPLLISPQPIEQNSSNRVVRQFFEYIDHFIRVTFTDEDHGSILDCSSSVDIMEERLRKIIHQGLFIGGRHFVFLAFSNSQIREQSCWFFDESARPLSAANLLDPPTAQYIRDSIGNFSSIRIIGKHAARMGQGFSSTIPVASVEAGDMEVIEDVNRNGFCFSDGVGLISQSFAERISREKLKLNFTPSAFQVRFGGGKGMLTSVPDKFIPNNRQICFRQSMMKFDSVHRELEINGFARPMPFYLNRQIISIFSSRGIKDQVFIDFLYAMIEELDNALNDNSTAKKLLLRHGDIGRQGISTSGCAYRMLDVGMSVVNDPFLQGIVRSIRNRLILDLRKKARIHIPGGQCLIGVMDEFSILKEGEVFIQISEYGLENRIVSCPRVVVGRNPSLHPGDIRVLKPRNIPELRHLIDVIVFPALGNRPHPNEMSGGDLDGDIYFVIEDEKLIPNFDVAPMLFAASTTVPKESESSNVTATDIGNFFVDYIKNDNLGQIANSHQAHADFSDDGASCKECIELAKLHSLAVDFVKTGIPAVFPTNLRLNKYPHFMENARKDKYESIKVLGKIFDICEKKISDEKTKRQMYVEVDEDLYVTGSESYLERADQLMCDYNEELWRIMRHFGIYNEFEALTGFALSFSRRASPKGARGGDAQYRLNNAVHGLKTRFRSIYFNEIQESAEDKVREGSDSHLIYSIRAQQVASAWYYCAYRQQWDGDDVPPFISFPWIAFETLCEIKKNSKTKK